MTPKSILHQLDLDRPFTFQALCTWIEARTHRQLDFRAWTLPPSITGAWLRSPTTDYVFYPDDAGPGHQRHCQLHELAHILCDHNPVSQDAGLVAAALGQACPAGAVVRALYRHRYTHAQEREAETLATRLEMRLIAGPTQVFDDADLDRHVQRCLAQQDL